MFSKHATTPEKHAMHISEEDKSISNVINVLLPFQASQLSSTIYNTLNMPSATSPLLRVAIIGGGPGGLGTAIALSALPNVQVCVFEQAKELREIGAGIRIGYNCWKVLGLLGADHDVKGHLKMQVLHR